MATTGDYADSGEPYGQAQPREARDRGGFTQLDLMDPGPGATSLQSLFRRLSEHYLADEDALVHGLLGCLGLADNHRERVAGETAAVVRELRAREQPFAGLDSLLRRHHLSDREGVILLCVAEELLRLSATGCDGAMAIGDTAIPALKRLLAGVGVPLGNAPYWGLLVTGRDFTLDEAAESSAVGLMDSLSGDLGEATTYSAIQDAMRLIMDRFVLGSTLDEALERSACGAARGDAYSYYMPGEAARTDADVQRYFSDYAAAITRLGRHASQESDPGLRPGIAIKLSALHPRFEAAKRERVLVELPERVVELALRARQHSVAITIDAEEAERLELTLEVFQAAISRSSLHTWGGLGIAVQAYAKRALPVLHWLSALAVKHGARIPVRLVKGAYWDTEIKHAQELGLPGYPVFTRKASTDVSFLACARYLLSDAHRGHLQPQFATHNAHTLMSILELAGDRPLEFQRLHGMGGPLHESIRRRAPDGTRFRIHAPVGAHRDLRRYLARRLFEIRADSSFVHQLVDPRIPSGELCHHPAEKLWEAPDYANPCIRLPVSLYGPERPGARGVNFSIASMRDPLLAAVRAFDDQRWEGGPVLAEDPPTPAPARETVRCPFDRHAIIGSVRGCSDAQALAAIDAAALAFPEWNRNPVIERAMVLNRAADLIEENRAELLALCARESGMRLPEGLAELRTAVDYCRYYALQAISGFGYEQRMPGPTGEANAYSRSGRGVFATISPANLPVSALIGQIAAALVAGNTVLAKPARRATLLGCRLTQLLHAAGVPAAVLQLLTGPGDRIGRLLAGAPKVDGVAFTGSAATARRINRVLANREDASMPTLIAETTGVNAMIADAGTLPEQFVPEVIESAFTGSPRGGAALRTLFLHEDIADSVIAMLRGAMAELETGDPRDLATDVGPVRDGRQQAAFRDHLEHLRASGQPFFQAPLPSGVAERGWFVAPTACLVHPSDALLDSLSGPLLRVARFKEKELDAVIDGINATSRSLTLGVHTRRDAFARRIDARARTGNLYVNRSLTGPIVGVQPFGGIGLPGSGPKAGGPHYLLAFTRERTRTVNTTILGGNGPLFSLG